MRLRQAGAVALTFVLIMASGSAAVEPTRIEPITATLFRPVDVPDAETRATIAPVSPISDFRGGPTRSFGPRPIAPRAEPKTQVEAPTRILGTGRLTGLASWYCRAGRSVCHSAYPDTSGFDAYAAAGPGLRAAICGDQSCTSWRGMTVTVNGVPVTLVDWCQCYWKQPHEKLIDLYYDVFEVTGGNVDIGW